MTRRRKVTLAALVLAPVGWVASAKHPPAHAPETPSDRTLSTVSLNIAKETDASQVVKAIRSAPRLRDADLYLFQEVCNEVGKPSVADEVGRQLGYRVSFAPSAPEVHNQGLAIVSRYPIANVHVTPLKTWDLHLRSRIRIAQSASIESPWGEVRVWNVHLDTRINAQDRLDQLRPVMDAAARHSGPRLIGGDFNTNDLYWVGHLLPLPLGHTHTRAVREAMKRIEFESPLPDTLDTFPLLKRHLDWIYFSGMTPISSSVEPAAFSDHNAIWARVRMN